MLHATLHADTLEQKKLTSQPTRDGFGKGLVEAGKNDSRIVAVCADLAESTRIEAFQKEFPDRYIEVGVAEQNLATVGSGLAAVGKIPFISSYATFSPGRNNEQIRTTIALNNQPVKIIGSHAGLSVGPDGATHQALEDVGLMRMLPNMTVIVPADAEEAYKATVAIAKTQNPAYLRLSRAGFPVFTTLLTPFEIGKALSVYVSDNPDVGIIASGTLVYESIMAAHQLAQEGLRVTVVNMATIKPLDHKALLDIAKQAGCLVTCEEHQIAGGLGSAVAEFLSQHYPVPMRMIGVHDRFGQSGKPEELLQEYGLDRQSIMNAVRKVRMMKRPS